MEADLWQLYKPTRLLGRAIIDCAAICFGEFPRARRPLRREGTRHSRDQGEDGITHPQDRPEAMTDAGKSKSVAIEEGLYPAD